MIKLLKKIRDILYSASYRIGNLAEKIDDAIYEREPPKESTMSESMRQFVDEQVLEMSLKELENFEKLFPKRTYGGGKIEFRKFSTLPKITNPIRKSIGDVFYIVEDEQGK